MLSLNKTIVFIMFCVSLPRVATGFSQASAADSLAKDSHQHFIVVSGKITDIKDHYALRSIYIVASLKTHGKRLEINATSNENGAYQLLIPDSFNKKLIHLHFVNYYYFGISKTIRIGKDKTVNAKLLYNDGIHPVWNGSMPHSHRHYYRERFPDIMNCLR